MISASEVYKMYEDAEMNDTQTYSVEPVAELRDEREDLHAEIANINAGIETTDDGDQIAALRQEKIGLVGTLEDMDRVLDMAGQNHKGYLVLKRVASEEWHTRIPMLYMSDDTDASMAVAVLNTHAIIESLPKESS
jgi:hypothetical protein